MSDNLIMVGAGGHARVCAEIAILNGYKKIIYLDDNQDLIGNEVFEGIVEGKIEDIDSFDGDVFVGIGDPIIRGKLLEDYIYQKKRNVISLIHPSAVISETATLAKGVVIMAGAVVTLCGIDVGVIVNTCSSVDHDCYIHSNSHVAVGAHLCGNVEVGKNCWIGAGATIVNNVNITDNVTIGAGAVVLNSITEPGTYVGVPAKRIK